MLGISWILSFAILLRSGIAINKVLICIRHGYDGVRLSILIDSMSSLNSCVASYKLYHALFYILHC